MLGSCFVMGSLRNFHHSSHLLRWTCVLLSQPVKGDKMSGRQQINYFRNSLQVLFTMVLDYPVLQTSFPWPWPLSWMLPSFPGRGPSFPPLMVVPRSARCSSAEIHVSGPAAGPELPQEVAWDPCSPIHPCVFRSCGKALFMVCFPAAEGEGLPLQLYVNYCGNGE